MAKPKLTKCDHCGQIKFCEKFGLAHFCKKCITKFGKK